MPTAHEVRKIIHSHYWSAYTLAGGYAVDQATGKRRLFPPCRVTAENRNQAGRVTRLEGEYPDGSKILFTFHPSHGSRLECPA